jgi:hypothetical protein
MPLTPAARPRPLPDGLTVDEAVRIADALTTAHAESTRSVYDFAWSPRGRRESAPTSTERAPEGLSVGTTNTACGPISYRHRMHGLHHPLLERHIRPAQALEFTSSRDLGL